MSKDSLKGNCGEPGKAASFAERSRKAPAGQFDGGMPPSGPKSEPSKLNGVKPPKTTGIK